jgi:uncharacterized protein (TIGR03083 family)
MDVTQDSIAAWNESLDASIALGEHLTEAQWASQTECPEWTVKDVFSHLVGGEQWMAEGHPPPSEGLATIAERPVAQRRDMDPQSVLAELRDLHRLRQQQLHDTPPDPTQPATTAYGAPVTLGILLTHRAFDVWVHEQDVRRAIGAPGNLGAPAATFAYEILVSALPRVVAKLAAAPPGTTVRLLVDGQVAFDDLIAVDGSGRGQLHKGEGGREPATVTLQTGWETFSRLTAGRIPAQGAAVTVTGDTELGARILAHIAVTP